MPIRTCVGCRSVAPQRLLIRIVAQNGQAVVDPRRVEPGRGTYLHPQVECLEKAIARRSISRALRTAVVTDSLETTVHWENRAKTR